MAESLPKINLVDAYIHQYFKSMMLLPTFCFTKRDKGYDGATNRARCVRCLHCARGAKSFL